MKMGKTSKLALLALGATALTATTAYAGVGVGMTSATLTPNDADGEFSLIDFTVGSTLYTDLFVGDLVSSISGSSFYNNQTPSNNGGSGNHVDDPHISTGIFGTGLGNNAAIEIDTVDVSSTDAAVFYLTEFGGNDDGIVVRPLDASNNVIPGWSLTLDAADYSDLREITWNSNPFFIAGTTFTVADFTGGAGILTSVSGLQIETDERLDPGQIGVAFVPEPASALVLAVGAGLVVRRRRM